MFSITYNYTYLVVHHLLHWQSLQVDLFVRLQQLTAQNVLRHLLFGLVEGVSHFLDEVQMLKALHLLLLDPELNLQLHPAQGRQWLVGSQVLFLLLEVLDGLVLLFGYSDEFEELRFFGKSLDDIPVPFILGVLNCPELFLSDVAVLQFITIYELALLLRHLLPIRLNRLHLHFRLDWQQILQLAINVQTIQYQVLSFLKFRVTERRPMA